MPLPTPYVDSLTADSYLASHAEWTSATPEEKANALVWGRIFLDSTYICQPFDELAPPEEVKLANALAASYYLQGKLFEVDETGGRELVSKTVRAGDVSVQKMYRGQFLQSAGDPVDKFPDLTALLSGFCTLKKSSYAVQSVALLRT